MSFWVTFIAVICVFGVANADPRGPPTFAQDEAESLLRAQTILRKHFIHAIGEVRDRITGSEDYENILTYILKGLHTRELDPLMAMRNIPANQDVYEYIKLATAIYNLQGNTQNRKTLKEWTSFIFSMGVTSKVPLISIDSKRLEHFRPPYVYIILKELKNKIKANTQLIRDTVYNYPYVNLSPDLDFILENFSRQLLVDFSEFRPHKNSNAPEEIMMDILNFIYEKQSDLPGLEVIRAGVEGNPNIVRMKDSSFEDLFALITPEEYPNDVVVASKKLLNKLKNNEILLSKTEVSTMMRGYSRHGRFLGLLSLLSLFCKLALSILSHFKFRYLSLRGEYFKAREVSDVTFLFRSFLTIENPMNPKFVEEIPKLFPPEIINEIDYSQYTKPRELVHNMTNALLLSNVLKYSDAAMVRFFLQSNGYKEVRPNPCNISTLVIDPVPLMESTPPKWVDLISSQRILYEDYKNYTKQELIKELLKNEDVKIPEDNRPVVVMPVCEKSCPERRQVEVINPSDLVAILNFTSSPVVELIMSQLISSSRYGKYQTLGEVYKAVVEDRKEKMRDRYPDIDFLIQITSLNSGAARPAKFIKVCLKAPLCPPRQEFKLTIDPQSLLDTINNISTTMKLAFPKGQFLAEKYEAFGNRGTILRYILRQHYSSSNGSVLYPELMKASMEMILNEKSKRPPVMVEACIAPEEPEMNSIFVYDIESTFNAMYSDEGIEFILEHTRNYFIPTTNIYNKAQVLELILDTLGPRAQYLKEFILYTQAGKETPIVTETHIPKSILRDEKALETICRNGVKILSVVDNEKLINMLETDLETATYLKSRLQPITIPIGNPEKYTKGDILTYMLMKIEGEISDVKIKEMIQSLKTNISENEQGIDLPDVIQICLPDYVIKEIQADYFPPDSSKPSSNVPPKSTTVQPSKFSTKPNTTPASNSITSQTTKSPIKPKPTIRPTQSPSKPPTTIKPTQSPSKPPTTSTPTQSPSKPPTTITPTQSPSKPPTTITPTQSPSKPPTTSTPTQSPSKPPTTITPTQSPSKPPTTITPTQSPSKTPTTITPTQSSSKPPTTTTTPPPPPPPTTTKKPPPPPPPTTTKTPPPPPPTTTKKPPPPPPPTTTTPPPPPPPPPTTTTPPPPPPPPPTTTTPPPPPPTPSFLEELEEEVYDYVKDGAELLEYLLS